MDKYIRDKILTVKPLHSDQHAYRAGRSTETALSKVHMLGNRNITITKGNTTLQGIVDSGCPQGGVLSPLMGSLVVDELLHLLTDQGCHPIGYADDILVIVRAMHLERIRGLILRGITGASKSSPTTALGAIMGLEPLHLSITAEASKAA